jgi:hypothetical protein
MLTLNEHSLPNIHCPFLFGEETVIMHLKQFTPEALSIAAQYSDIWENRILIETPEKMRQVA